MIGETTSRYLVEDKLGEGGMGVIYKAQDTRLYPGALDVLATEETPALQARHSIVIAEFANATPDPVFDGWLRQAVAVDREQSPFLNVVSDRLIADTLKVSVRGSTRADNADIQYETKLIDPSGLAQLAQNPR